MRIEESHPPERPPRPGGWFEGLGTVYPPQKVIFSKNNTMQLSLPEYHLRPLQLSDRDVMATYGNNVEIWKNLRDQFPHPYTPADAERFIQHVNKSETSERVFGIVEKEHLVGVIGIYPQSDVYRGTAELGYWLGQPFWGKGIATAAVRRIVEFGFEELHLRRIFADVFASNPASRRVLEKAGFQLEGVRQLAIIKNEQIQDDYHYAIVNPRFL
jgi:ribosomal-protein-alanine N-acetyltransferase